MVTSPFNNEKREKFYITRDKRFEFIHFQPDETVSVLLKKGVFPNKEYEGLLDRKPAGIIKCGKQTFILVSKEFIHDKSWEFSLAEKLNCRIICFSGEHGTYWFHANGTKIKDDTGNDFRKEFDLRSIFSLTSEKQLEWEVIFNKFEALSDDGVLREPKQLNPKTLSERVWQKIWIVTGKEPIKCLYNFVEIFIFKFLSDVGVLWGNNNFDWTYQMSVDDGPVKALEHYANHIRKEIEYMFPKGADGTTITNGTIFVTESGEPNVAQANLFADILKEFYLYGMEHGSFKHINKQFKTRIYESFLRKSAGVSQMGQFFTPRNVITAIVKMLDEKTLKKDLRMCDPFCGVGGFLLEFLNEFPAFLDQFKFKEGKIEYNMKMLGIDKGSDEKEDERTIVLAKANLLIYFSSFLSQFHEPAMMLEFSKKVLNEVFLLKRTNLGTFEIDQYENYFDLILTNPPYVTSGIRIIKQEIQDKGLEKMYPSKGQGLEALAIDWIIRALKPGGRAFVVVPDGILSRSGDLKLRSRILRKCVLDAIISLPEKTFFATSKKTYILAFTKKKNKSENTEKVFTYLVNDIGETKDANRFEGEANDLDDMYRLFKEFMANKQEFVSNDSRCIIQSISRFEHHHWLIDKDWSAANEKILSEAEFEDMLRNIHQEIETYFEK